MSDEGERAERSTESLLASVAGLPRDDERRRAVVEEVVRRHRRLVHRAAARYSGRGEDFDVLEQVAYVGLMEAIDRFDPDRGTFVAFAQVTVLGLVRRHFRDRRRWIQLPRRLQNLQAEVRRAQDELAQTTGHEPDSRDLAAYLHADEHDVTEADSAVFHPLSLDAPASDETGDTLGDLLGHNDERLDRVVDLESLRTALADLPLREREILLLRFYGSCSQTEIGARIGISQMQVCRILAKTRARLRERVLPAATA